MIAPEIGDIIWVDFPFVESGLTKSRPALVVSEVLTAAGTPLIWVMMITNAAREPWSGDVLIEDYSGCGLPAPSKVRSAKIATIEIAQVERAGRIDAALLAKIQARLRTTLKL